MKSLYMPIRSLVLIGMVVVLIGCGGGGGGGSWLDTVDTSCNSIPCPDLKVMLLSGNQTSVNVEVKNIGNQATSYRFTISVTFMAGIKENPVPTRNGYDSMPANDSYFGTFEHILPSNELNWGVSPDHVDIVVTYSGKQLDKNNDHLSCNWLHEAWECKYGNNLSTVAETDGSHASTMQASSDGIPVINSREDLIAAASYHRSSSIPGSLSGQYIGKIRGINNTSAPFMIELTEGAPNIATLEVLPGLRISMCGQSGPVSSFVNAAEVTFSGNSFTTSPIATINEAVVILKGTLGEDGKTLDLALKVVPHNHDCEGATFQASAQKVIVPMNLGVQANNGPEQIIEGQHLTYRLLVTNHGPVSAQNAVVQAMVPTNLDLLGPEGVACTPEGATQACAIPIAKLDPRASQSTDLVFATAHVATKLLQSTFHLIVEHDPMLDIAPEDNFVQVSTQVTFRNRIRTGLQALYTFEEGAGSIINDVSGVGTPLNLKMSDSTKTQWTTDGLLISGPTTIASLLPATKIVDAARASNEISLEAWVKPATSAGATSGSIIALSTDTNNRNITLEQQSHTKGDSVNFLSSVRTSTTAPQGVDVKASDDYPAQELAHVVLTRDAAGNVRLYVNGVEQKHKTLKGDFSSWDSTASLALANELLADTAWLGEYQLVAAYSRDLNPAEVRQNYHSGPKGLATVCYATADKHDGVSDQLIVFSDGLPRTTPVRTIGTDDIEALAFQPVTNVLYAANADQLGILDLVSGKFAPTRSTFGKGRGADGLISFKNIDGLAFDQTDGTLYGVHRRSEDPSDHEVLFQIDVGTGAAIPDAFGAGVDYVVIQGAGLLPDIDDIAIEPQSGQMYATSDNNGQGGVLIAIDKHTGVAIPKDAYGVEDVDGLTFTENGTLYGLTGNSNRGNTTDSQIYAINLDNGQASFVSQLDRVRDYEAAACRPALRSAMVRSLLSVEPGQGPAHQVVPIMVTGTGFVEGSTIRIGTAALQTTFVSNTQLQARVPPGLRPGLYNIVVVYPDGTSDLLPSAYNVFAPTFYAYLPVVQP